MPKNMMINAIRRENQKINSITHTLETTQN